MGEKPREQAHNGKIQRKSKEEAKTCWEETGAQVTAKGSTTANGKVNWPNASRTKSHGHQELY